MNNDNNSNSTGKAGGVGFLGLLALVFITLKLTGFIDWSWVWVLAPLWIPVALVVGIVVITFVALLVEELADNVKDERRKLDREAAGFGIERRPGESNLDLKRRIAFFKQSERRNRQ